MKGKLVLPEKVRHDMIKIGRADVAGWERRGTSLCIEGDLIFEGEAAIGSGSALEVKKGAVLTIGEKFRVTLADRSQKIRHFLYREVVAPPLKNRKETVY